MTNPQPLRLTLRATGAALLCACAAQAGAVVVPGTSNPKLAGMPDGTTASSGDVAPAQSPVLAVGSGLVGGSSLTFAVSTISPVGNCPGCTAATPDGSGNFSNAAENGISGVSALVNSLLGVFLGPDQPNLSAAPASLSFLTAASRDFLSLSPELKQVFFIGDGLTSGAAVQSFVVPAGATRLYLATHDGFGWYNNVGAYEVVVNGVSQPPIPEPQTYLLMLAGIAGIGAVVRRRRAS